MEYSGMRWMEGSCRASLSVFCEKWNLKSLQQNAFCELMI